MLCPRFTEWRFGESPAVGEAGHAADCCAGRAVRHHDACAAHLVALNAGGRQAAAERGWTIVDVERMSAGCANTSVSPAGWVLPRPCS